MFIYQKAARASDGSWSAKQPHRKQKERADQAQDTMDGDTEDAQGKSQKPNDRVNDQGQQRDGPTQNKQNAPQKERSHGNLAGKFKTRLHTLTRISHHSLITTKEKAEKFLPLCSRRAAVALRPTRESQHQAACANRRSPNAGRAPGRESLPAFDLRPAVAGWKA